MELGAKTKMTMAQDKYGVFDHLVSGLPGEEKKRLLEKIKKTALVSGEPLVDEKQRIVPKGVDERYAKLSLFTKFLYWIIGLFTGRQTIDIYINSLVVSEGRSINEKYPGMFDYEENLLKSGFKHEIQNLKEAARFFYAVLDSSVQHDRGAFFGYLVSLQAPDLHKSLVEGTDPERISIIQPDDSDVKLRTCALEFIEQRINGIEDSARRVLYENSRTLIITKALASFLYDRLIMSFTQKGGEETAYCPANIVFAQLCELTNILFSLKVPSLDVLSALFLFSMEKIHGESYNQDEELQKFLNHAEKSILVIRNFNRNVPLLSIIRCTSRNFLWEPLEISGGEDWFNTYKNYWISLTNKRFYEWIREKHNAELTMSLEHYFKGMLMEEIDNAWSEKNDTGIPVNDVLALSFILSFHKLIFMNEINIIMRPILLDGEFYKKENRIEFIEAYNIVIKLDDTIKNFNSAIGRGGEFGQIWQQIEGDMQSVPVRRRKTQSLLDQVNQASFKIVSDAQNALISTKNVLCGILEHGDNAKYDTISNYAQLAGKGNGFSESIKKSVHLIKEALEILNRINELNSEEAQNNMLS
ncbi:MAG: DUF5312 domain-containing protein [Spirochaetaceae bacterium]|nr:DUF5312 domain-containing protein [Spirochaetaceae bacterium]